MISSAIREYIMSNTEDKIYLNAFNLIPGFGSAKFKKILSYFKNTKDAWQAARKELILAEIEPAAADSIIKSRGLIDPEKEWQKLKKENIDAIAANSEEYPTLLKEIYDPPAILYVRGDLREDDKYSIGVVGTRKCTTYGQQTALEISENLALAGFTIVSGLAKGIDTLAHKAAVENKGRTIAVLGSGLDFIYPRENKFLAEKIVKEKQGVLVSEYPLGTSPLKQNFPARNRIISGLSLGVLVIEAAEKSGALITARQALEQNREVFAVPGSIYSKQSFGPNNLIKMGAKLVCSYEDILEELNMKPKKFALKTEIAADTEEEAKIIEILSSEPSHIDKIIKESKFSPSAVNSTLTIMEIKGKIRALGNNVYMIVK